MSCTINLHNIEYTNDSKEIFKNISLDVGHHEKVAIIGANGCGKSTLLKIAAGLIKPTNGYLKLFHTKINNLNDFKKYRNEIAYLPQDVSSHFLCPTVLEDVMFSLRTNGVLEHEAMKIAKNILKELEILHLENRIIFDLSGGEQKIVALAGLLVLKPKILLLDEPTNALDEISEKRVVDILNSLNKSMIIVSHHKSFIESLTPTIYKLNKSGLEKID